MATNLHHDSVRGVRVAQTDPAAPVSGGAVLFGNIVGVALNDEESDNTTVVDFGPAVYNLPVHGADNVGNAAVAAGDKVYYDAAVPELNVDSVNGVYAGIAIEGVTSGATTTIKVMIGVGGGA